MLSGHQLAALLHTVATGFMDGAKNLVLTSEELEESERTVLYPIVDDTSANTSQIARRLGDAFRELSADRALVNECYRLAFYAGDASAHLSANPLFSYFAGHKSGRVLDKWVHYFPIYDRHLSPYRGRDLRVLEIGVYQGGSLDMWQWYLGPSSTLIGIDIDETATQLAAKDKIIVIGDQSDRDFLASVVQRYGPFDIIIDDGGHTMEQQITSIDVLFPSLVEGGVYIVEDCHTSYWEAYGGGRRRDGTFIEWIKDRIDDLHGVHYDCSGEAIWTEHVDAIHCYDSVVVLDKKHRIAPFAEQVGSSDFVFNQRPVEALVGEMRAQRDAALAHRDAIAEELAKLRATVEEELRITRGELALLRPRELTLEEELIATRNDLLEAWTQLRVMRQTLSWRITSPLRLVRRRFGDHR